MQEESNADRRKLICLGLFIFIMAGSVLLALLSYHGTSLNLLSKKEAYAAEHRSEWKILHIMSYHSPWQWTDDQFNGFKGALKGLNIEYKVFQMDTKRKSGEDWKTHAGIQARKLINSWHPDLVYTSDDNAQKYVTAHYINKEIPFVFSGVNANPNIYGFNDCKNITGVIEQEHFIQTVELLKEIVPGITKIAVILDDGPTWDGVVKRMKAKQYQIPGIQFVSWDVIKTFDQYKEKIISYQGKVDAIASLGIFTYTDREGKNVSYKEVLKWTANNSTIPDFSFWKNRVNHGTLCAVTVSGYEQGMAAGKIAKAILLEGRSPSSFIMRPTLRGEPVISLSRAQKLGIKIRTSVLLSANIIEDFAWAN